jgi:hypothetical protein
MKDTLEVINQDFKSALLFEDSDSRFKALDNVAKETNSSDIPNFLKARILNSIREHQFSIVSLGDLKPCFEV